MYKGTQSFVDHYSCFFDTQRKVQGSELVLLNLCQNNIFPKNPTKLESLMLKNDIIDVYICGLALDICVGDLITLVLFSISSFLLNCLSAPKICTFSSSPLPLCLHVHVLIEWWGQPCIPNLLTTNRCLDRFYFATLFIPGYEAHPLYFSASTAYHSLELGFRTILIDDCSRGIKEECILQTFEKVKQSNGCVVHSSEVMSSFYQSF